ncbi:uncharacterized protein LOC110752704 [Prunus avium]|uniref:Uncharacterized protein LOC110752704 n=1 Tax=Prunus avium TaxID=42229 RepID=A0A6P5S5P0_PRUAV|nr:uncharacterized protein LOC110752704 [Prunus avium]
MGSRLVSLIVKDKVRNNPLVRPIELITDLNENYGLDIPYHVAWYGKESVTKYLHGDEELSYAHLPWYVDVLKASNVGSHCVLDCGEDGSRFQQIFICFKASIDGFRWCRLMLFIDGTFVTNKYKGTLLGAIAKNGNKGRQLTFIFDRHGAIIDVVRTVFPSSPHGFCLYHLKDNLKKKYPHSVGSFFKDHILWLFCKLLYAPTVKEVRRPPIYELIDTIRIKMMDMISRRKLASEKWCSVLCSVIQDELKNLASKGRDMSRE